jgi:ribosome-associated protein
MPESPTVVTISNEPIRLGQFLKLANLAQDGFEARVHIQNGAVWVNGVVETRRGRKLSHGDQIRMRDELYLIECIKKV